MTIFGIDLGTTNSLVAVLGPGGPITLPNELDEHLTPSAVAYAEDGTLLVGRAARDRLVVAPDAGRAFFKRDMGTPATYMFGGKRWTPTECSAVVLREMKRLAERWQGAPVTQAVVTVPAYFHEPQRQATIEAARLAGLTVQRILNEPTAAALAYRHGTPPEEERRLLVFDLGGGTFDVTVLELFEGIVEVRASAGDSRLGGEDVTDALLALAVQRAGGRLEAADRARLRQRVEVAKRHLSERKSAEIAWDGRGITLTREDLTQAGREIFARLLPHVRRCLNDAQLAMSDIDEVLLVGGASRMPAVIDLIAQAFGRLPDRSLDPDRVVALGAAVQAARVERKAEVRDLVMTDVCPHSLGTEVCHQYDMRVEPGYFDPILDRNQVLPVSRERRYHTMHPQQDRIELCIYQGESRRVEENTLLGKMHIDGLRARPGQQGAGEVDVRFTYDANGILEVEVSVLATGKKHVRVIESRPGALTPAQVREALERLQPVKVRARDLLPNRARIERAQRLYLEQTGLSRRQLEECLTEFEDALERGDAPAIAWAAARLDQLVAQRFAGEDEARPGTGPGERPPSAPTDVTPGGAPRDPPEGSPGAPPSSGAPAGDPPRGPTQAS